MVLTALTKTCKWIYYLLVALLIFIALLLACVRLAVSYSKDYSEELAALVSSYVGSPVEIGEVDLVWNRFDASASLKDVQVRSGDDAATMLELSQIDLLLDVREILLKRKLSVRSVQLSNLSLVASYEGEGEIGIMGQNPKLGSKSKVDEVEASNRDYSVLNWLFNAERISILDSDIKLIDAPRNREFEIDHVNIRAFNDNDLHQIRITSALPGEIGESSVASLDFTGAADDIKAWKGKFYVNTQGINIDQLSEFWSKPSDNYSGITDLQVWGEWSDARVDHVRAIANGQQLSFDQLQSADATSEASINADRVEVDVNWSRTESGWQMNFGRLFASLEDEIVLDGLDMHMERNGDGVETFGISGPDISLESLQPVYAFVDALRAENNGYPLQNLRGGEIKNWLLGGVWQSGEFEVTALKADVENLAVDAFENNPGISDLSVTALYRDGTGYLSLDNQDINLSLPALFDKPLPVINTDGVVKVLMNKAETNTGTSGVLWKVVGEDLRVATSDLNTSTTFSLLASTGGQRLFDLHTNILSANLANSRDYLPVRVMSPTLYNWLQTSIETGDIVRGRVELKGDIGNYDPAQGVGHFYAEADIVDAQLKFLSDWPSADDMDGNISFTANTMRGQVYKGQLRQAKFSDARVFIRELKQPVLELQTDAIGPVADMLDFAQTGPLAPQIGSLFGDASGDGISRLGLDVKIPLNDEVNAELTVDGEVRLDNAELAAKAFGIDIESATGNVRFSRDGVLADDLQVRYQGLPLAVKATRIEDPEGSNDIVNRLSVSGPVALSSVMNSYGIPLVEQFEGTSNWDVDLDVKRRPGKSPQVKFTASSDLSGTQIKLPAPLYKAANTLKEVSVSRDFSDGAKDWWVEMPGLIKARVRATEDKKLESMAVAIGRSNNTVLPVRGIALHGDAQRVDAMGWVKLGLEFQAQSEADDTLPLFANVSARQMLFGPHRYPGSDELGDMIYIAYRDGPQQVHRIENPLVSGELRVRGGPDKPLVAELERLNKRLLTAIGDAEAVSDVTSPSYDPRDLRPLDISVKELEWDNWRFSQSSLRTQPSERGLRVTALTIRQDSFRVSGSGFWDYYKAKNGSAESHVTKLDLNASFENFGRAIANTGGGNSFAEGAGEAALSLTWPKPGYAPDLSEMTGQLLFNLREGRILTVDPGAGRILGLFALQALPRRLAFDFRDITDKGFEYARISGNMSIADGNARANAIVATGPVAEILIRGNTDFVAQTYDQVIDVLPRVSGALPLLGVISGGPAAGLTALLAESVLRGIGVNLDEIGRQRYTLKGDWDSPQLKSINQESRPVATSSRR